MEKYTEKILNDLINILKKENTITNDFLIKFKKLTEHDKYEFIYITIVSNIVKNNIYNTNDFIFNYVKNIYTFLDITKLILGGIYKYQNIDYLQLSKYLNNNLNENLINEYLKYLDIFHSQDESTIINNMFLNSIVMKN
jgi:hypothetical protein